MQTYRIHCLSESLSPISHMQGTVGNEAIIAREEIVTSKGRFHVPKISGNALRHKLVREPGAWWLIERLGLMGKLTRDQLNFLLHGGTLSESTAGESTARIARVNEISPFLKLLGGCLPNQVLTGSLDSWHGTLVCEENRRYITQSIPREWDMPERRLQSAEAMVGTWQYVRSDAAKSGLCAGDDTQVVSSQMIFNGQAVNRHALFYHGFLLEHCTPLELGALLLSISVWQHDGGTIGGQAARGHGRLLTHVFCDVSDDFDELIAGYIEHVDAHADAIRDFLNDSFRPTAAKKPKKGAKNLLEETLS